VLQGVSQQQARVRLRGQVSEQINMHSDVVLGVTSRPAAQEVSTLAGVTSDKKFDDVEIDGQKYLVGFSNGVIRVWDTAGTEYPVVEQDQDAIDYIGDNMSFHVYDDTVYVTNQDVVVAEDLTVDTSEVMLGQGLIQSLGGVFGQTFTATILYDDAVSFSGTHNIPDTDPDNVNAETILAALHTDILLDPNIKASTTITREGDVLLIADTTIEFTITTEDGDGGDTLRSHNKVAKKLEDLVRVAPHGTFVKVEGEEKTDDDFYMRFDVEDESTVGAGFGTAGTWREWVNVEQPVSLDLTTMPHVLFRVASTFYFQRNFWQPRRVGDIDSNPHPSFVGFPIQDMGGFQSRLTFTAGPNWVAGRTNIPSDLYRKSVVVETDTDPLDIASTTESEVALRWQVPFDRDLLLMSDNHQFIVSGLTALTPNNAGMLLTTDFEMAGASRPSSTGRTILFPYTIGTHAGLKEFFASDEIATNGADNVTESNTTYIDGEISYIATSTNFYTSLILTDDPASSKTVWVYKYLWEGLEKKQSSWSKWTLPYDVHYVFWDNADVYAIMRDGSTYVLAKLDMDFVNHDVGFRVTLDRYTDEVADGSFQVTVPYDDASFVAHTGCTNPGRKVLETAQSGSGPFTYTFAEEDVPSGATVVAGLEYTQSVTPTMPFIRDREGRSVTSSKLVITDFTVLYENSGSILATMTSKFRTADKTHSNTRIITDDDPEDTAGIGIRSGEFVIPWGERTDWSELTLAANDGIRPIAILEVEWRGQVFKRGTRT